MTMLEEVITAALNAGRAIMEIYSNPEADIDLQIKEDDSPLTLADRRSHSIIADALAASPFPLLSEEGEIAAYERRAAEEKLWIVDPLDGTKEFLKHNDEFTVNIALVKQGVPVLGVVYAPALYRLYYGTKSDGAFVAEVDPATYNLGAARRLPLEEARGEDDCIRIVASRSHLNEDTAAFIENVRRETGRKVETVSAGSSLKLCLVAEGRADVYPRLAPTMEWDTAAGHAVALAAGCQVVEAGTNRPLVYNKPDLHNPRFVVSRKD